MPRAMSFAITTQQMRAKTKRVTRRLRWTGLQPGDLVQACEKCMGFKKGERRPPPIGLIRIVSTRFEQLKFITAADCALEGFPEMNPNEFVTMFCAAMKCDPETVVNRIEFEPLY